MKESVKLGMENKMSVKILQIAFAIVMAAVYAVFGAIFLLSGIAFLIGIESLEILTFSNTEMLSIIFLVIADIILGIAVIITAGAIVIIGLRQKNIAH